VSEAGCLDGSSVLVDVAEVFTVVEVLENVDSMLVVHIPRMTDCSVLSTAFLREPVNKRVLSVHTDRPCVFGRKLETPNWRAKSQTEQKSAACTHDTGAQVSLLFGCSGPVIW
jgi:hypothetical protein